MSEKIFAWLLTLYPLRFREEYGAPAMQLFRERLQAEQGFLKRFRLWLDIIADLIVSVPREHRRPIRPESNSGAYRLSEGAVSAISKRKKAQLLLPFCIFGLLGVGAGWLGHSDRIPLLAAYAMLTLLGIRNLKRMGAFRKQWRSYELILGADRIQQRRYDQDLTLLRSEVGQIVERPQGLQVLSVIGSSPRTILVPVGMIGYQEVRSRLSEWTPITQAPEFWLRAAWSAVIGMLCLLPAVLLTRSASWFLILTAAYYGLIFLEFVMNLVRPLNSSWQPDPRRPGLQFATPAHTLRRFKGQCRHPWGRRMWLIRLGMIAVPLLKMLMPRPAGHF
jgi:hypothetical protein